MNYILQALQYFYCFWTPSAHISTVSGPPSHTFLMFLDPHRTHFYYFSLKWIEYVEGGFCRNGSQYCKYMVNSRFPFLQNQLVI
jgi:hypothetical protein